MKCKKCGHDMKSQELFCSQCGEKQSNSAQIVCNTEKKCPKCESVTVSVQAVPNKTRRRLIKTVVLLIVFIIPLIWGAYINRDYSIPEGMLVGGLIAIPLTIVASLALRIVFRFIPEPYDTLFICGNCGNNWRD